MIQQHQNQWPGPNSEFRNAFSKNWQEHVLESIGLGRGLLQNATPGLSDVPKPKSPPFEEEFDTPSEGEPRTEGGERGACSGRNQQGLEHLDTLESLELPEPADPVSPARAPQPSPAVTPLPSPMLEVPPTPTPSESPRSKPMTSPRFTPALGGATPSMTPMASPMWQPLSEALLPTPQPKAEPGGAVAPPTPMSIFAEAEAPKVVPMKTAAPSPKPLDVPLEDPGSSALLRLLWPSQQTSPAELPRSGGEGDAGESECVLKTLFRMPDFRDILLEGIGLPKFPSMEGQSDSRGKRKHDKCDRSEDIFGSEPYAKRYRQIWEILQPPFSGFSTDFSSVAWASSPPKLSRYEKLGQTESMESVFGRGAGAGGAAKGTSVSLPSGPHAPEKRKRLVHSEITRHLWGRVVQPLKRKVKSKPQRITAAVLPPLSKKRWSGKVPPTAQELSLSSGQPFVLYEYIEENPTLMMNAGMGHEVLSYFLPRKKSYEGEPLGPLQSKTPIQINGPLPHLLASQIHLKPGQGVAVMDCPVLQAPLVSRNIKGNRFLLVWNRNRNENQNGDRGNEAAELHGQLHLRPLSLACVVGQVEPSRLVPAPSSESKNLRSSCIRHMLREVQHRWQKDFSGELEDGDENQIHKAMAKDVSKSVLQWFPDQGPLLQTELKELKKVDQTCDLCEAVCLLEAMRRGEERLQILGIDNLYQADSTLTKALQDLELLERRKSGSDNLCANLQILRSRWILEQLQITPWNLSNRYASFIKKGSLLAIAGPGDPSNGRLEGVSFLPVLVKYTAECLALSKLCVGADQDIAARLTQLGVSEDSFEPLSRWDRIALLCTKLGAELEKNSDCFVTGWSRATLPLAKQTASELKKKHGQLLQEAFQRQLMALSHQLTEDHSTGAGDQANELEPSRSVNPDDEAALIEALEDSPEKDGGANAITFTPHSEGEDDKMEMQRLRRQLGTDEAHAASAASAASTAAAMPTKPVESAGPAKKDAATGKVGKVKMLKIVTISLSKTGQMQERVLYVFGEENIRLYREIRAANETMGAMAAMGPGGGIGPLGLLGPGGLKSRVGRVGSNLSKVSEQSRSTATGATGVTRTTGPTGPTTNKRKSKLKDTTDAKDARDDDERVSSCSKKGSEGAAGALKALDRDNLLKRRRSGDSASKVTRLS